MSYFLYIVIVENLVAGTDALASALNTISAARLRRVLIISKAGIFRWSLCPRSLLPPATIFMMTVCRVWRILASTRATDGRNRWSLRLPQWWSCPVVGSPYRCSYDLPVVSGSSKFFASCPSPETTDQLQGPSPATGRLRESGRRRQSAPVKERLLHRRAVVVAASRTHLGHPGQPRSGTTFRPFLLG